MKKEINSRKQIAVFKGKRIRRLWDAKLEKWYFSVVDVVEALSASSIPRRYWSDLKTKLQVEGSQVYEKIVQPKYPKKKNLILLTKTGELPAAAAV